MDIIYCGSHTLYHSPIPKSLSPFCPEQQHIKDSQNSTNCLKILKFENPFFLYNKKEGSLSEKQKPFKGRENGRFGEAREGEFVGGDDGGSGFRRALLDGGVSESWEMGESGKRRRRRRRRRRWRRRGWCSGEDVGGWSPWLLPWLWRRFWIRLVIEPSSLLLLFILPIFFWGVVSWENYLFSFKKLKFF